MEPRREDRTGRQEPGIGARVRAARQRLGWSREALAFHSGISWSAITQVESGRRRNVRPATLEALAAALGLTIDYLVHGAPPADVLMLEHQALLYGTEAELVATAGPFLAGAVERSEAALAVTTKAKIELLRDYLGSSAEAVEFVEARTWYRTPSGALEAYKAFVEERLEQGAPWVRIAGEPLWAGRPDAEIRLWTRYEALLNLVFSGFPVAILCLYDERSTPDEALRQAHATHPATIPAGDGYSDAAGFLLEPGS
jgi:transcriptional regulator with XRE-family HTH domain